MWRASRERCSLVVWLLLLLRTVSRLENVGALMLPNFGNKIDGRVESTNASPWMRRKPVAVDAPSLAAGSPSKVWTAISIGLTVWSLSISENSFVPAAPSSVANAAETVTTTSKNERERPSPLISVEDTRLIGEESFRRFLASTKRLEIRAMEDPQVQGVTLFLSSEQASANSLSLVQTASKVTWKPSSSSSTSTTDSGRLSRQRTLIYRQVRPSGLIIPGESPIEIIRYYDEPSQSLVYVVSGLQQYTYDGNYKARVPSSICSVHVDSILS